MSVCICSVAVWFGHGHGGGHMAVWPCGHVAMWQCGHMAVEVLWCFTCLGVEVSRCFFLRCLGRPDMRFVVAGTAMSWWAPVLT